MLIVRGVADGVVPCGAGPRAGGTMARAAGDGATRADARHARRGATRGFAAALPFLEARVAGREVVSTCG
ncbi:hypothetical protein [Actinomycetospora cinnamomea]|nr:hypothetical protein [Actinomycetospora cinnamomea]